MKHTKEQIISMALQLFIEKSYKSLSTNQVLKELGLTKGGFYHHFDSKEQLAVSVAESLFIDGFTNIINIAKSDLETRQKIDEIASITKTYLSSYTDSQLTNYYIFMLEIRNDIPSIKELIHNNYEEVMNALDGMFEPNNNPALGMMLMIMIEGILYSSNIMKHCIEEHIDGIFDNFKKCLEVSK